MKPTIKQVVAGTLMELIICGFAAFLFYQFSQGINTPLGIFCCVIGILWFIGMNILMIFLIRKEKHKG